MADPGPGFFRCDACGGIFDTGDEQEAIAEAEAKGFNIEQCGTVCDECYEAMGLMIGPPPQWIRDVFRDAGRG